MVVIRVGLDICNTVANYCEYNFMPSKTCQIVFMIDNDYSQCVKLKKAAYCMPDAKRRHVAKVALRSGLNKRKKVRSV